MTCLAARIILDGACDATALVTRQPMNFPAALCKIRNLLPGCRAEIRDEHHELFGQNIAATVLVFPSCVGSTYTGMVLLDLVSHGRGPAGVIVNSVDPLLVSGFVLSEVWYGTAIPVLEYSGADLFAAVASGDRVRIEAGTGRVFVSRSAPSKGSGVGTGRTRFPA